MISSKKLFNFIILLFLLFNCQINPPFYLSVVAATYSSGSSLSNGGIDGKMNSDGSNVVTISTYLMKFNNNINTNNNNNNVNINYTKYYENNNILKNYNNKNNYINFKSLSECLADRLVTYKVVLHTYWARNLFPKHYPDWRPQAQWTKTIGRSHDSSFSLFHIGQKASPGVKQFAESGKTELLENQKQWELQQQKPKPEVSNDYDKEMNISDALDTSIQFQSTLSPLLLDNNNHYNNKIEQSRLSSEKFKSTKHSENSVFDEFDIPAISTGVGRNEAKFFVDGNHSLISLMTRIVPSPDWFIGIDSLQLCIGGSWLDTVTVEMEPLDAGTDNGFTFTAPNWPTEPQGVIYRITSRYPAHPAGSFFYPKSKRLPPIATFQFIKLKEYEISEVFNFEEDEHKYDLVKTRTHLEVEHNHVEMNNELSASIEKERQSEIKVIPIANTEKERVRAKLLEKMNPSLNNTTFNYQSSTSQSFSSPSSLISSFASNVITKNDKDALIRNIANNYNFIPYPKYIKLTSKAKSNYKHHKKHFKFTVKDCRVSHWSKWSSCSKTCGIGEMHRHRKIIKHVRRGGKPCPPLQESKWCGTARGCHSPPLTLYNWSNT